MHKTLFGKTGFSDVQKANFCYSKVRDYLEPLHVEGMDPIWRDLNQEFYKKNGLTHYYDVESGKYEINFNVTGFDRDPLTSLIIEAQKTRNVDKRNYLGLNESPLNYNRYAWSLLKDPLFKSKYSAILDLTNPEEVS